MAESASILSLFSELLTIPRDDVPISHAQGLVSRVLDCIENRGVNKYNASVVREALARLEGMRDRGFVNPTCQSRINSLLHELDEFTLLRNRSSSDLEIRERQIREEEDRKARVRQLHEAERQAKALESERHRGNEELARQERDRFAKEAARRAEVLEGWRRAREAEIRVATEAYEAALRTDYLTADREVSSSLSPDVRRAIRTAFVKRWASTLGIITDDEQASAIGVSEGHHLVAARAGSGKTRTLVTRAAFLVKHCRVSPEEILLLAFNRKAAAEMRLRLEKLGCPCPHVMTFHALAYAIVHPEQSLVFDEPDEGDKAQSAVLDRVIRGFLDDPNMYDRIRGLMLDHFRADWDALEGKGLDKSMSVGLEFRRSLVSETLGGDLVKSGGEKLIANFLFEHGVPYLYERSHWWEGRNYRPDFTIEGPQVVVEYFGMAGEPEYDEQSDAKRAYWARRDDWQLLEYGPELLRSLGADGFRLALRDDLARLGIPVKRLSEEDIWERIRERVHTRFAKVLRTFVSRCRKVGLDRVGLAEVLRQHTNFDDVERRFLAIAAEAFAAYLDRLENEGLEDFDGLLERAAAIVESGATDFNRRSGAGDLGQMRFILVDEFQDFSPLFFNLLKGLRRHSRKAQMFCVGDDWQAINGFAGSDLVYFHEYDKKFKPSTRGGVTTNYRSSRSIVEVGNRIMAGKGEAANPYLGAPTGRVLLGDISSFSPAAEERKAWPNDQITPAVRRLIRAPLAAGKTVALLSRRSDGIPYFVPLKEDVGKSMKGLGGLHRRWTEGLSKKEKGAVDVSTAHGFKGLEADVVIVLDAVDRSYPLIHQDWVFSRVFGDNIPKLIEDERRLFYVACTRAVETLILLTEGRSQSEFLKAIRSSCGTLAWDSYPPFVKGSGGWIVKVGNQAGRGATPTIERRNTLKANGFAYLGGDWKHWYIGYPALVDLDGVVERLKQAPWLTGPDGLEIRICTSDGAVVQTLSVADGTIQRTSAPPEQLSPHVPARPPTDESVRSKLRELGYDDGEIPF